MSHIASYIRQRLSLRKPLAEALEVVEKITDTISLEKQTPETDSIEFCKAELAKIKKVFPHVRDFERDFPSFAFSIATGIGKTRLMGACIAYLYLTKGIKHFFVLAPNIKEYTTTNGGKPWKYIMLRHDLVTRTSSFYYLIQQNYLP